MSAEQKLSCLKFRRCNNTFGLMLLLIVSSTFLLLFSYADQGLNETNNAQIFLETKTIQDKLRQRRFVNFSAPVFTYDCISGKCVRSPIESTIFNRITLETCNMQCASPPIWPKPTKIEVTNKNSSAFTISDLKFIYNTDLPIHDYLVENIEKFQNNLNFLKGNSSTIGNTTLTVEINLEDAVTLKPKSDLDESYKLNVINENEKISIKIDAVNRFGVRHALETLSQLIWFDSVTSTLRILHDVEIKDAPAFTHRGLMVDTARHFFPVTQLYKIVDGMAASKLNVLHLHLTDAESFPIVLNSVPEFAHFGSYSSEEIYKSEEIQQLIKYAELNGIRVILEIDAPSHTNTGWNLAELSNDPLVICEESYGLNGHLNPDNDDVLAVLEAIYSDLIEINDHSDDYFHIGGDEVILDCWRHTKSASKYHDLKELWASYTNKIIERVKSAYGGKFPKNIVLWSSPLTDSTYLQSLKGNITVQFWLGNPDRLLAAGKTVIYSTVGHWYLDCGFGPYKPGMSRGNCDPYTPWQKVYDYRPWAQFGHVSATLGGEVCLFGEQVVGEDLETRIWPRTAAFAERLWSDPNNFDDYDVYTRLVWFRERLVGRGVKAAGLWPRWCSQNPGLCKA